MAAALTCIWAWFVTAQKLMKRREERVTSVTRAEDVKRLCRRIDSTLS